MHVALNDLRYRFQSTNHAVARPTAPCLFVCVPQCDVVAYNPTVTVTPPSYCPTASSVEFNYTVVAAGIPAAVLTYALETPTVTGPGVAPGCLRTGGCNMSGRVMAL